MRPINKPKHREHNQVVSSQSTGANSPSQNFIRTGIVQIMHRRTEFSAHPGYSDRNHVIDNKKCEHHPQFSTAIVTEKHKEDHDSNKTDRRPAIGHRFLGFVP